MKLQRLYSLTRQAVDQYHLIDSGDHIAIGVSGGKDSLALLYALKGLSRFYPAPFKVSAITVDLGFGNFDLEGVYRLCEQLEIPYKVIPTQISKIVFEAHQSANPCSLCAKLRKGALVQAAKDLGCNKIAYAHHMDDVIETMMMSLLYEGRFYAFPPYTFFEDADLAVIRPLLFLSEADIKGFQNKYELPVCKNPCPADGRTRREYVKQLIRQLEHETPGAKKRMFHAVLAGNIPDWIIPEYRKESSDHGESCLL